MYPTLYHFFYDVFGIEINFLHAVNSFGFFVAMAFLVATWLYSKELKRREELGWIFPGTIKKTIGLPASPVDLLLNGLLGFLLGYKLIYAFMNSEVFSDFPGFLFSAQGNIIAGIAGAAGMAYWKYYESRKQQLEKPIEREELFHSYDHMGAILIRGVVWGFVGAKLFAFFENDQPISEFLSDPFRGLTMYGGLICAAIALTFYFKKHKLPVLHFYDGAAPALMIAYGVGRIGCHVSGDGDWGIVNTAVKPGWMNFLPDWLWSYSYPNNVNGDGVPIPGCVYEEKYCNALAEPVFPTPFYEFLMCLFFFAVLWYVRKKISIPGILFFVYLFFNGIERFLIESIRVNVPMKVFGNEFPFTQAQFISFSFIFVSIGGIIYLRRKNKSLTSTP